MIYYNKKCDYIELFWEKGIDNYSDGNEKGSVEIFRAEDDDRIVGVGIYNPKEIGFIDELMREFENRKEDELNRSI